MPAAEMDFVIERNLHEVAKDLTKADLLLFRGMNLVSRAISIATRSKYTHAGKIDRWGTEVFCCEVRQLKGGRIVTLASQVARYPGRIDVYRTNADDKPGFDREASAAYMRQFAGQQYGWASVFKAALQYLPVVRWFGSHDYELENGTAPGKLPYCSQATASADRHGGGIDPVPNLADRFTTPGDLARTPFNKYLFTLMGL